jgi:hypothetical protein
MCVRWAKCTWAWVEPRPTVREERCRSGVAATVIGTTAASAAARSTAAASAAATVIGATTTTASTAARSTAAGATVIGATTTAASTAAASTTSATSASVIGRGRGATTTSATCSVIGAASPAGSATAGATRVVVLLNLSDTRVVVVPPEHLVLAQGDDRIHGARASLVGREPETRQPKGDGEHHHQQLAARHGATSFLLRSARAFPRALRPRLRETLLIGIADGAVRSGGTWGADP